MVKNLEEALYIIKHIADQYIWISQYKTMSVKEFKNKIESEEYGELFDTHILWWLLKEEYDLALTLKKEINVLSTSFSFLSFTIIFNKFIKCQYIYQLE